MLLSLTLSYDGWAIPWYRFLLDWVYYTPMRTSWRYREHEPFGLRNEALRTKIARAVQRNVISEVARRRSPYLPCMKRVVSQRWSARA